MNVRLTAFFVLFSLSSGLDPRKDYPNVSDENWEKLLRVNSMSDFRREFNFKDTTVPGSTASDEEDDPELHCIPRPKVIRLRDTFDTGGNYLHPPCITANRCGGCCTNVRFQCEPVNSTTSYQTGYLIGHDIGGYKIVSVPYQTDLSCDCKCKLKEKEANCNEYQVYDEHSCACKCKSDTPIACPQGQQYSSLLCKCVCSHQHCEFGGTLNQTTCKCEMVEDEKKKVIIVSGQMEKDERGDNKKENDISNHVRKKEDTITDLENKNNEKNKRQNNYSEQKNRLNELIDNDREDSLKNSIFNILRSRDDNIDVNDVFEDIDDYLKDFNDEVEFD